GGTSFGGIAFNATGQIFMSTNSPDNKLYRLENNLTLTYLSTFSVDGVGNDLTSCNFPLSILPVSWVSFSAALKNDHSVLLSWEFGQQQNTKGYSVEYSNDAVNWEQAGFIQNTNSDETAKKYSFTHVNSVKGKYYYRIHQQDLNGNSSYSDIKTIEIKMNA